ncbi:FtsZ-binding cell division protein ZapB [Bradyrhizobium sp. USDA 4341]
MKTIPKPTELNPRIAELENKRNSLQAEKTAKVAEAAIIRARIQTAPSNGNAADNRVRSILGQAPLPDADPDMPRLDKLLLELSDLNKAIGILDSEIRNQRDIGSRLVCDAVKPDVMKRAKAFAKALFDLHAAHTDYDRYLDEVENTSANISSLNRVFLSFLGSSRDPCGGYHYSMREFVDAGVIDRSDMPQAVR